MKVLLTGGSKGIGLAILTRLHDEGHFCIVVGRHSPPDGLADEYWGADFSSISDIRKIADRIVDFPGGLNAVINNAGTATPSLMKDLDLTRFAEEIQINLLAPFAIVQAALPRMLAEGWGRIINICSISAKRGTPTLTAYSAAKAGLVSLTQSTASSVAGTGVTVNALCPGGVVTETATHIRSRMSEINAGGQCEYENEMLRAMGLGKMLYPEDVSQWVSFILSEGGSIVTGQAFNLCGNWEIH